MARTIRASGERKPNATPVISRIVVLTDSIRPWASAMAKLDRRQRSAGWAWGEQLRLRCSGRLGALLLC